MLNIRKPDEFQDKITSLYPGSETKSITFQVTEKCTLNCSYCYEINKRDKVMNFETAKKFIDLLFEDKATLKDHTKEERAVILDFIGGEPLLEIELIDQIVDYFVVQAIRYSSAWAMNYMIAISTNGTEYFNPKVQSFIKKHFSNLSMTFSVDGDKEMHDACRKFHDGRPSYELVESAVKHYMENYKELYSKITIAPENVSKLYTAVTHMHTLGYRHIHANCVYEEGWTLDNARELYKQAKMIADYFIEKDIVLSHYCSLFKEDNFSPIDYTNPDDNKNHCGGNGDMIALDSDGIIYPCLRFMPSSLGDVKPITMGNVEEGFLCTQEEKDCFSCMKAITRKSQSPDKCHTCKIAKGCGWCTAYNYQVYGTPDKRTTYICDTHKALALANVYFFNKYYIEHDLEDRFEMHIPKEWALEIIDEEEYNRLEQMSNR